MNTRGTLSGGPVLSRRQRRARDHRRLTGNLLIVAALAAVTAIVLADLPAIAARVVVSLFEIER